MNKKVRRKTPKEISPEDIKIRKIYAPGVRVFISDKEKKKDKHKKDWLQEEDQE